MSFVFMLINQTSNCEIHNDDVLIASEKILNNDIIRKYQYYIDIPNTTTDLKIYSNKEYSIGDELKFTVK